MAHDAVGRLVDGTALAMDGATADDTQLIVSELVTKAVRYGSPPIELRLIHDRTLTCEVRDTGSAAPHLRHAGGAEEGGRGLFIAAQLAQAWGTRYTTPGKTIWTEQTRWPVTEQTLLLVHRTESLRRVVTAAAGRVRGAPRRPVGSPPASGRRS
jgi:hypothetical protein